MVQFFLKLDSGVFLMRLRQYTSYDVQKIEKCLPLFLAKHVPETELEDALTSNLYCNKSWCVCVCVTKNNDMQNLQAILCEPASNHGI